MPPRLRSRVVPVVAVGVAGTAAVAAFAATTHTTHVHRTLAATPSTLARVYASARGGETITLAAGDYGTFTGGSRPSTVTLAARRGARVAMTVRLRGADHLAFRGMEVSGAELDGASHVAFVGDRFTGQAVVRATVPHAAIVFDRDRFDAIDTCSSCFEGRLQIIGNAAGGPSVDGGVAVTRSRFSGGNADGVQITGGAAGVRVGPGNEFTGLYEISAVHTDAVQTFGAGPGTVIAGNWFHDTADGVMAPDGGDGTGLEITGNVCARVQSACVYLGFKSGVRISHNTFLAPIVLNDGNGDPHGSTDADYVITGNVLAAGISEGGGFPPGAVSREDYNLWVGGRGPHDVRSVPRFAGGASPRTRVGFRLASGSPGVHAADDGSDIGAGAPPPGSP
jgi:hypothetical protein